MDLAAIEIPLVSYFLQNEPLPEMERAFIFAAAQFTAEVTEAFA
ncbi:hypothetical protein K795_20493 [Salmonella enterica subsp. enterica serovar Newport str. SHSN005]|nr:hypothetical protein K795_20493 [Salmonella enterica subsp. enterica serovar Newport str. SHSN005]